MSSPARCASATNAGSRRAAWNAERSVRAGAPGVPPAAARMAGPAATGRGGLPRSAGEPRPSGRGPRPGDVGQPGQGARAELEDDRHATVESVAPARPHRRLVEAHPVELTALHREPDVGGPPVAGDLLDRKAESDLREARGDVDRGCRAGVDPSAGPSPTACRAYLHDDAAHLAAAPRSSAAIIPPCRRRIGTGIGYHGRRWGPHPCQA
jgi:hypothetical protein